MIMIRLFWYILSLKKSKQDEKSETAERNKEGALQ